MKIGIISDTHDNLVTMLVALKILREHKVELIVHCGDWVASSMLTAMSVNTGSIPVKGVIGNNAGDLRMVMKRNAALSKPVELSQQTVLEIDLPEGGRVVCYHGEDDVILEALIRCEKYKAVFTGHTHAVRNEIVDGVLVLNPGTTSFRKLTEVLSKGSVAVYDSASNSADIISFPWPLDAKKP